MIKLATVSLALVLPASLAFADPCEDHRAQVAALLDVHMRPYNQIVRFCEACGDEVPGVPIRGAELERLLAHNQSCSQVSGRPGIDAAHTYVQTTPHRFENLALMLGCPTDARSPSLRVTSETDDGVLIVPDTTPVATLLKPPWVVDRVDEPEDAPALAAPPPPAGPAHITYYSTTIEQPLPWSLLALAALGGCVIGASATVLVAGLRRRPALRPRATDLRPPA